MDVSRYVTLWRYPVSVDSIHFCLQPATRQQSGRFRASQCVFREDSHGLFGSPVFVHNQDTILVNGIEVRFRKQNVVVDIDRDSVETIPVCCKGKL